MVRQDWPQNCDSPLEYDHTLVCIKLYVMTFYGSVQTKLAFHVHFYRFYSDFLVSKINKNDKKIK
jgi:hypothetical protein